MSILPPGFKDSTAVFEKNNNAIEIVVMVQA
jgi:hypothetical protein